jgi:hypothetical protein
VLVGERLDYLVASHSDVPVDAPHWKHDLMAPECSIPGKRVLVVGVHQRSVDVKHADRHFGGSTREGWQETSGGVASACTRRYQGTM